MRTDPCRSPLGIRITVCTDFEDDGIESRYPDAGGRKCRSIAPSDAAKIPSTIHRKNGGLIFVRRVHEPKESPIAINVYSCLDLGV